MTVAGGGGLSVFGCQNHVDEMVDDEVWLRWFVWMNQVKRVRGVDGCSL